MTIERFNQTLGQLLDELRKGDGERPKFSAPTEVVEEYFRARLAEELAFVEWRSRVNRAAEAKRRLVESEDLMRQIKF